MKFKVNGREYKSYQLTNEELVELLEKNELTEEQRKELNETLFNRFKFYSCKKLGETEDELFARQFSYFVNGKMNLPKEVAKEMAKDHRYLQAEMFKVCKAFIEELAENYAADRYDPRNEWACEMAAKMAKSVA